MQFFIDNFDILRDAFLTTLSLSLLAGCWRSCWGPSWRRCG